MQIELRQVLQARYQQFFTTLDRSIALVEKCLGSVVGPVVNTPTRAVSLTIFARMYNTSLAARALLHEGFGIQAGMLARSILEDYINLHYITDNKNIHPDELSRRYIGYQRVIPWKAMRRLRELGHEVDPEAEEAAMATATAFRREFADGTESDWSGKSLRSKAMDVQAGVAYLLLQEEFSGLLHGGPASIQKIVQEGQSETALLIGPHDVYIDTPIPALCLFLTGSTKTIARIFDLPELSTSADTDLGQMPKDWKIK